MLQMHKQHHGMQGNLTQPLVLAMQGQVTNLYR